MNKYGALTPESKSDFDPTKKAEFYDEDGFEIADVENKQNLKNPQPIDNLFEKRLNVFESL
jgi:hypothetical protein